MEGIKDFECTAPSKTVSYCKNKCYISTVIVRVHPFSHLKLYSQHEAWDRYYADQVKIEENEPDEDEWALVTRAALWNDEVKVSISVGTSRGPYIIHELPKAMVVHFSALGSQQLATQSSAATTPPISSVLHIEPGLAAPGAVAWVVAWMKKASQHKSSNDYILRVEHKLGFIKNLAIYQAILVLGIITPADYFESYINKRISTKQLTADEIAKIWTTIPVDSRIMKNMVCTLIERKMNGTLNNESAIEAYTQSQPALETLLSDRYKSQTEWKRKLALRESNAAKEAARIAQVKKNRDKAERAQAEWVEPAKHAGGAYEKVLKPGQRTRSGLAA
ncbi:hypothetical protein LTR04_002164 [Oleoguttula sp. CCFEE 6159]|nr:hypothetical protein LTR04_002164 [Oleoguttula sp. CCFEE 6159]